MPIKKRGLYDKFQVLKGGEPLDGPCFVLRYDRDPAAWMALMEYWRHCDNSRLRGDLVYELQHTREMELTDVKSRLERELAEARAEIAMLKERLDESQISLDEYAEETGIITDLNADLQRRLDESQEKMRQLVDLHRKAFLRGLEMCPEEHKALADQYKVEVETIYPDGGELVSWLVGRFDAMRSEYESMIAALEPYDARDSEFGYCVVCQVDGYPAPHDPDCAYVAGIRRFGPEWEKDGYEVRWPEVKDD